MTSATPDLPFPDAITQPLLQVMATSIVEEYGQQSGIRIAERAILRLSQLRNEEAVQIWLKVHALLHLIVANPQDGRTLH
jgi:hypothetical protein